MEERRRKGWIARARQTRRDAEKDGSCVRRINIYIYRERKRERWRVKNRVSSASTKQSSRAKGIEERKCTNVNEITKFFLLFFLSSWNCARKLCYQRLIYTCSRNVR